MGKVMKRNQHKTTAFQMDLKIHHHVEYHTSAPTT